MWATVTGRIPENGLKKHLKKINKNYVRVCLICKTVKNERQCDKWERRADLPARSRRISRSQMHRKVGTNQNIGSKNHWVLWRESQDGEGTEEEEVTSCSILPPFTFVNVQEIGWENTRVAAACPDPNRAGRVKHAEGEG